VYVLLFVFGISEPFKNHEYELNVLVELRVVLFTHPSPVSVNGTLGTALEFIAILPVAVILPHPPVRITV
jgi:hypothetical protein